MKTIVNIIEDKLQSIQNLNDERTELCLQMDLAAARYDRNKYLELYETYEKKGKQIKKAKKEFSVFLGIPKGCREVPMNDLEVIAYEYIRQIKKALSIHYTINTL